MISRPLKKIPLDISAVRFKRRGSRIRSGEGYMDTPNALSMCPTTGYDTFIAPDEQDDTYI